MYVGAPAVASKKRLGPARVSKRQGRHGMSWPVGRPPMNVKATVVRLPKDVPARIARALGPKEKKADLIRLAIEKELQLREADIPSRSGGPD